MNINTNFIQNRIVSAKGYIWLFILSSFTSILICLCLSEPANAQIITQDCQTTVIVSEGQVVPGSEITTCTTTVTNVNDGSQFLENQNNSCGSGNPCPEPPEDNGTQEPLPKRVVCQAEQEAESARDAATREAVEEINEMDPNREHMNFIVNLNDTPTALTPVSGDRTTVTANGSSGDVGLFIQMEALGLNESHLLVEIHSHPGTPDLTDASVIRDDIFVNSFPSVNDYEGLQNYVDLAVAFGADEEQWRASFAHVIIGRDNIAREFENFTQPEDEDFTSGIPLVGSAERNILEERLENARNDAEGECGNE